MNILIILGVFVSISIITGIVLFLEKRKLRKESDKSINDRYRHINELLENGNMTFMN